MENHAVVTSKEWIAARQELLAKEKEFTRLRDELSRQRRELPWERVEKEYVFEGPDGKETLRGAFRRAAASSSSTTSCSRRTGACPARAARSGPTTSTASSPT